MPEKNDKLPWMKFYDRKFTADTQALTAASTGIWIRVICEMHYKDLHTITRDVSAWTRQLSCTRDELMFALKEFDRDDVADVLRSHGNVTLTSRLRKREEERREYDRLRKQEQRDKEKGLFPVTDISEEVSGKSPSISISLSYSSDFDSFWDTYPRKIGKVKAKELYIAIRVGDVPAAMLLNAAEAYADEKAGDEPRFILHPSTFLGPQRLWEDYAAMKGWSK